MTYVPPEKKQKGKSSNFGDIVYIILFYLIEGLFIFIGIPFLILALGVVPVAMFLIITEGGINENISFYLLISLGVMIVYFQILGVQYFVRKFILEPHKMTFGEWLRWRFSPNEIKKRREEKNLRSQKMDEYYDGMGRLSEAKEKLKEEQEYNLRDEWFGESIDPKILQTNESEGPITLGGIESDSEMKEDST